MRATERETETLMDTEVNKKTTSSQLDKHSYTERFLSTGNYMGHV